MIDPTDRGFTLGHGLFETILWSDGSLQHWEPHLARLDGGCAALGLPAPDPDACRRAAEAALVVAGRPARAAVRLNWSAGPGGRGLDPPSVPTPSLNAVATAVEPPAPTVTLVTATTRRNDGSITSRLKTLAYLDNVLARAEARAAGADEALMLNTCGDVACAAAANVFWIAGNVLRTPALSCGVLDGVIRRRVTDVARVLGIAVEEVVADPRDLTGSPMFLTNSLIGVQRVSSLGGRPLPQSPLIEAFAGLI